MQLIGTAMIVLGLAAMLAAFPVAAIADDGTDMPRLIITTVCTIYSDYLDDAVTDVDAILGTGLGGHMPECEVTSEYVGVVPTTSVMVDIAPGALFPTCAEDRTCFDPYTVSVDVGAGVVWTNSDNVLHTVTEPEGTFDGWMLPGEEFVFTFDTPGTYVYGCTVHPWASGVVVVGQDAGPETAHVPEPEPTASSGLAEAAMEEILALFETYGDGALERINAMAADPDPTIGIFVVDEGTMLIVAHSLVPQYVGLDTVPILEQAFIPVETMLDIIDAHRDAGVWLSYPLADPQGNIISYDRGWFKKHGEYIVGVRYSVGASEAVQSVVYETIRLYDYDPGNALDTITGFMSTSTNYPFVLDPKTDKVVAHGSNPDRVGATSVVLTASDKPKAQILVELAKGEGTWVEYTFTNPTTGLTEAKRSWLVMHDGYIFGSGYYGLGPERAVKTTNDIIAMYDSQGTAAFDTVNGMESEDVYPFAIRAETLTVVAEGAFPQVVGLPATFLNDADPPIADILAGLESDGVWVEYVFSNPQTASYETKTSYLVMHDGYIFGSGYYTSLDAGATDAVNTMLRLYNALGEGSFTDIDSARTDTFNSPFVLDAATLDIVAHANPNLSGGDVRDAITSSQSLEFVSGMLEEQGNLWLSYPSADPMPGSEYTRAFLFLYDGYVFASGYGIDAESRLQSLVDESVRLYEQEGDATFDIITSMDMTNQWVYDVQESTMLASSQSPEFVGLVVPISALGFDRSTEEFLQLYERGGAWLDRFLAVVDGIEFRQSVWSVMVDDRYIFMAMHTYSPEIAAVAEVDMAIDLYETYGDEAFARITWQAVNPEIIYPFVVDAEVWRTVAHAAIPDWVGVCCSDDIAEYNDLDDVRMQLENAPGVWVEYTFYNPISKQDEFKRVWLAMHGDYIFGSGYYYGNFDHAAEIVAGAISNYDMNRKASLDDINSEMSGSLDFSTLVLDHETLDVVAHGGYPDLVGQNLIDIAINGDDLVLTMRESLMEDGDVTLILPALLDPLTGQYVAKLAIFQLHGEYIFATAQPIAIYTQ